MDAKVPVQAGDSQKNPKSHNRKEMRISRQVAPINEMRIQILKEVTERSGFVKLGIGTVRTNNLGQERTLAQVGHEIHVRFTVQSTAMPDI